MLKNIVLLSGRCWKMFNLNLVSYHKSEAYITISVSVASDPSIPVEDLVNILGGRFPELSDYDIHHCMSDGDVKICVFTKKNSNKEKKMKLLLD